MRNSRFKNIFSALLCAILLISLIALPVSAEVKISDTVLGKDTDYVYGYYRKYVHWSVKKSTQTLTVFGNEGEEYDETVDSSFYYTHHIAPFSEYIKRLVVEGKIRSIEEGALAGLPFERADLGNGIKRIGAKAFSDCKNLEKIIIPESVEYIGKGAFEGCDSLTHVYIYSKNIVIDEGAFPDSLNLKAVYFYGESIEIGAGNAEFEECLAHSGAELVLPILFAVAVSALIIVGFILIRKKTQKTETK